MIRANCYGPVRCFRVDLHTGCHEWQGWTRNGYGSLSVNGRKEYAHRLMWQEKHGPIPACMYVLHKCDNRLCCNVEHLFLGTAKDNSLDMASKGRDGSTAHPELVPRGERAGGAKLSDRIVAEIRRTYTGGRLQQKEWAQKYGVSKSAISSVIKGKTWRHVIV